jgi:hypothetical protein
MLVGFLGVQNELCGKSNSLVLQAFDLLYFNDARRTSHSLQGMAEGEQVNRTSQQFLQMVSIAFFIRASSATLWSCNDFDVEL